MNVTKYRLGRYHYTKRELKRRGYHIRPVGDFTKDIYIRRTTGEAWMYLSALTVDFKA